MQTTLKDFDFKSALFESDLFRNFVVSYETTDPLFGCLQVAFFSNNERNRSLKRKRERENVESDTRSLHFPLTCASPG